VPGKRGMPRLAARLLIRTICDIEELGSPSRLDRRATTPLCGESGARCCWGTTMPPPPPASMALDSPSASTALKTLLRVISLADYLVWSADFGNQMNLAKRLPSGYKVWSRNGCKIILSVLLGSCTRADRSDIGRHKFAGLQS
jgi:hypothetical protein